MIRRRRVLAALGAASLSAGCAAPIATEAGDAPESVDAPTLAETGLPPDICDRDPNDTDIHPIVDPAFDDGWAGYEIEDRFAVDGEKLPAAFGVIGIERGGRARAYPVIVLRWHEIVNDSVGGPLLVTYCPLCASGMTAVRAVDGTPTQFGVTGHRWRPPTLEAEAEKHDNRTFAAEAVDPDDETAVRVRGNLVMYDRATGSFWSQLLATAICGPERGERLSIVPAETTTWGEWRRAHPDTDVLLPPPHSAVRTDPF